MYVVNGIMEGQISLEQCTALIDELAELRKANEWSQKNDYR
jgi:hypothetical protein